MLNPFQKLYHLLSLINQTLGRHSRPDLSLNHTLILNELLERQRRIELRLCRLMEAHGVPTAITPDTDPRKQKKK